MLPVHRAQHLFVGAAPRLETLSNIIIWMSRFWLDWSYFSSIRRSLSI